MLLRRLLTLLAPLAVVVATAEAAQDVPPDAAPHAPFLPSVSAPPPLAPLTALDLLPPGVRSKEDRTNVVSITAAADSAHGATALERVPDPLAHGGPEPAWLEVEYTALPELDERVRQVLERGKVPLGHVVLMDPATGRVLSYVSTDPMAFPATRTYPTASLMKVVTAAAVLQHAPEAAQRNCRYVGSPYTMLKSSLTPPRSGGRVDSFWRAIAISNNQCFGRLAVHDVGKESLLAEMRRVGLLEPPGPRHPAGRVDPIEDDLDLGELGSGLAGSFITPLAAVRLASVLAEGKLVRPYWIENVRDAQGHALAVPRRPAPTRIWTPEVTRELRELMVGVTARGTARSAFRDRRGRPLLGALAVAGKTGSLSGTNPDGRYEWFIGVAPADAPRIAIAAVVVNGPKWWSNAADVAAYALREVFCESGHCDAANVERLHAHSGSARRVASTEALAVPTQIH